MRLLTEDQKISTNKRIYVIRSTTYGLSHSRPKEKNPNWKGGKAIDDDGYILINSHSHPRMRNKRYVLQHILVYEDTHNCCLLKWSIVHHKDENKQNNVWYNLKAMLRKDHIKVHPEIRIQQKLIRTIRPWKTH